MPLVCCVRFLFCYRRIIGKASLDVESGCEEGKLKTRTTEPSIFFVGTFCFKEKIFWVVFRRPFLVCLPKSRTLSEKSYLQKRVNERAETSRCMRKLNNTEWK